MNTKPVVPLVILPGQYVAINPLDVERVLMGGECGADVSVLLPDLELMLTVAECGPRSIPPITTIDELFQRTVDMINEHRRGSPVVTSPEPPIVDAVRDLWAEDGSVIQVPV